MKKWYNVEIPYYTVEYINRADNFKFWLDDNNIKYEISGANNYVHFEIELSEKQLNAVNKALDKYVWIPDPDAIYEI